MRSNEVVKRPSAGPLIPGFVLALSLLNIVGLMEYWFVCEASLVHTPDPFPLSALLQNRLNMVSVELCGLVNMAFHCSAVVTSIPLLSSIQFWEAVKALSYS